MDNTPFTYSYDIVTNTYQTSKGVVPTSFVIRKRTQLGTEFFLKSWNDGIEPLWITKRSMAHKYTSTMANKILESIKAKEGAKTDEWMRI